MRPFLVRDGAGPEVDVDEAYERALWMPGMMVDLVGEDVEGVAESVSRDCWTDPSQLKRTSKRSSGASLGCRDDSMANLMSVDSSSSSVCHDAGSLTGSSEGDVLLLFRLTNASMMIARNTYIAAAPARSHGMILYACDAAFIDAY